MRSGMPSWAWLILVAAVVIPSLLFIKQQYEHATVAAEAQRAETQQTMDEIDRRAQKLPATR